VEALALPRRPFLDILEAYFPRVKEDMVTDAIKRNTTYKRMLSEELKKVGSMIFGKQLTSKFNTMVSDYAFDPKNAVYLDSDAVNNKWNYMYKNIIHDLGVAELMVRESRTGEV
jgi:hypothetical protein